MFVAMINLWVGTNATLRTCTKDVTDPFRVGGRADASLLGTVSSWASKEW
jgi:hypothetical protein